MRKALGPHCSSPNPWYLGGAMRLPKALFGVAKEVARHLLRRPVVGFAALAKTRDGRVVMIRRGDTGLWALPGGTLEWGETLRHGLARELLEEAGVTLLEAGALLGVYSSPERDPRFHAVTIIVGAVVEPPHQPPLNPLEILDVGLFQSSALPTPLSHGMTDMARRALAGDVFWE